MRPCVLVANKADTDGAAQQLHELRAACTELRAMGELRALVPHQAGGSIVTAISARDRKNLGRLVGRLDAALAVVARDADATQSTVLRDSAPHELAQLRPRVPGGVDTL